MLSPSRLVFSGKIATETDSILPCIPLGDGAHGEVCRRGNRAFKKPATIGIQMSAAVDDRIDAESCIRFNQLALEAESKIYQFLGPHSGLPICYGLDPKHGLEMEYIPGGDLQRYMYTQPAVDMDVRLNWLLQIAETLHYIHSKGVIHADIATRNMLIDQDQSLKLTDFSMALLESERLPKDEYRYSVHADMFDFATTSYSILTWTQVYFRLDIDDQADVEGEEKVHDAPRGSPTIPRGSPTIPRGWPTIINLPSVVGVPLGHILNRCWLRKFENMEDVCRALRQEIRAETRRLKQEMRRFEQKRRRFEEEKRRFEREKRIFEQMRLGNHVSWLNSCTGSLAWGAGDANVGGFFVNHCGAYCNVCGPFSACVRAGNINRHAYGITSSWNHF